ncbi:hypothetical protein VOI54_04680 [Tamlana sp. 2201CG12-4]|uniref:hypothetical protein n=1 Tax=Tamlana sp. 2201CG12-4 TaxID=3112582 RepID=UPI002DBF9129|nr:hypothetical protein [Tamlana sp. 2201CG12-4]MEC3906300.1 hypothetical protein [Tamlana sp. 2201CG12-4]
MKLSKLYNDLEMLMIGFAVVIFTLGYTSFSLITALYCFLKFRTIKWPYLVVILFFSILIPGTILTLWNIFISKYDSIYTVGMLYRTRFFWIRVIFASGIFVYLYSLNYKEILKFVYYMSIPCTVIGLLQLVSNPVKRVTMLAYEASAAGMYYLFMVPLLLEYYKVNRRHKFWVFLFIFTGLFIRSKAQILVLPLMLLYFIFTSDNRKLKGGVIIIIVIGLLSLPFILQMDQLKGLNHFMTVLNKEGITGLTEKNQVWSTFTFRFSSFLVALQLLGDNLFGSGFGAFHPEYIEIMISDEFLSKMTGVEIKGALENKYYASPKSIFFDYLVSSGLFFLVPITLIVIKFFKSNTSILIKASLYSFLLVSLMVELSPFLVFLVISLALFYKSKEIICKI